MLKARMTHRRVVPLVIALTVACDSAVHPTVPVDTVVAVPLPKDTSLVVPSFSGVHTLTLVVDTSLAYVDRHLHFQVEARDVGGNLVDSDLTDITSSNDTVGEYIQQRTFTLTLPGGRSIRTLDVEFVLAGTGVTTFRARLGALTREVTLTVNVLPPATQALVVDSFYVVEQRDGIYPVYWPVLQLREPTGTSYATVVGVEFSVPTITTGLCRGAFRLAPGASDYAYYAQSDFWANDDIVMMSLAPVPDGSAFARVIVQDSQGQRGTIEVTGPILRGASTSAVPARDSSLSQWTC